MSLCIARPPASNPFFFFNDTATTEIYTLSLHDALPISLHIRAGETPRARLQECAHRRDGARQNRADRTRRRSEEHTSELQSLAYLVCRLLLEKKKYYPSTLEDSACTIVCANIKLLDTRH